LESSMKPSLQLGADFDDSADGLKVVRVDRGGSAYKAGLKVGDVVMSFDGVDVQKGERAIVERLEQKIGSVVKVAIKRAGREQIIDLQIGSSSEQSYRIVEMPNATPDQSKIREAWLKPGA
jgi:predicted metalloprotease with PDZ domain